MAVNQSDVPEVGRQKADIAIQSQLLGGSRIRKLETKHNFLVLEIACWNSKRISGERLVSERPFTDGLVIDVNQQTLQWKPFLHQEGSHRRPELHQVVLGRIHHQP